MNTLTSILAQASGGYNWAAAASVWIRVAFLAAVCAVVVGFFFALPGIWKVFTKAGQPGWAILIPIYNLIVLLRIAGLPWYWVFTPLVAIIPILGWVAYPVWVVWVHQRISTRFGQGVGFTIGLTLLSPIFWLILGFGDSKYVGERPSQA